MTHNKMRSNYVYYKLRFDVVELRLEEIFDEFCLRLIAERLRARRMFLRFTAGDVWRLF